MKEWRVNFLDSGQGHYVPWNGVLDFISMDVITLGKTIQVRKWKGFPKEERPFSTHLTLGRVRSGKNKAGLKEKLSAIEILPTSCRITSIILFQSQLSPKGPTYLPLHAAKLIDTD